MWFALKTVYLYFFGHTIRPNDKAPEETRGTGSGGRRDRTRARNRGPYLGYDQRRVQIRSARQPDAPRLELAVPVERHGPRARFGHILAAWA